MSEAGPYPFLLQDYYWYVFARGDNRYRIGWPHIKIEALTSGAPNIGDDVIEALAGASKDNRATSADFRSQMARLGFSFIGPSNFDFRSGTRCWQARILLNLAWQAEHRRLGMLAAQHGRAPEPGSLAWPEWWEVSLQAGSCATGARLLGYASIEAFVNEVLFVNFPAIFDEYEGPGSHSFHASVPDKLARLLKELGFIQGGPPGTASSPVTPESTRRSSTTSSTLHSRTRQRIETRSVTHRANRRRIWSSSSTPCKRPSAWSTAPSVWNCPPLTGRLLPSEPPGPSGQR